MKIHFFPKGILLIIVCFFLLPSANAQTRDTTIYFFKSIGLGKQLVQSADSADYIEVIPPFRRTDLFVDIFEYYKSGKPKFTGKAITSTINLVSGNADYEGPCVSFYPTGKRQVITTYKEGSRSGPQYFYYPDGKLYMVVDNDFKQSYSINGSKLMDCFDKNGVQLCEGGNGIAILYDNDFNEVLRGQVKKGKKDGEWHGVIKEKDIGKYTLFFKENAFDSGIGYEAATGKTYPFKNRYELATPKINPAYFVIKIRDLIKLPKGSPVTKQMIDSTQIYFVVEEDGRLSGFDTIGPVPAELMDALKTAFSKCPEWRPTRYFGIPLKTEVSMWLYVTPGGRFNGYNKSIEMIRSPSYKGVSIGALTNSQSRYIF